METKLNSMTADSNKVVAESQVVEKLNYNMNKPKQRFYLVNKEEPEKMMEVEFGEMFTCEMCLVKKGAYRIINTDEYHYHFCKSCILELAELIKNEQRTNNKRDNR